MTIIDFRNLESEVINIVNILLDKVKDINFSDYVLLLSRAGYLKDLETTSLSPYVTQSNLELIQDNSRRQFLHVYLNQYTHCLEENILYDNEMHEYNINMQLMLYSHVWESRCFLMSLRRIVSILSGNGYEWRISFQTKQGGSNKMIPINKGKFIREKVLGPLKTIDNILYEFLTSLYNSTIRNGYSPVTVTENTHKHCVCGGYYSNHECTTESWIAWGDDAYEKTELPFLSGNYYLVADITMGKSMLVEPGETIRLCLNGHTIDTKTARVVNNQGSLTVTDCGAKESWGTMTSVYTGSYSQILYNYSTGTLDVYAGNFRPEGSNAYGCLGMNQEGVFNLYGGDFKGANAQEQNNLERRGGTLYMMGGEMNIYGGNIYGGQAYKGGNIYAEKGTLRISGGTISGGQASLGGNIYGSFNTTIELSGGVIEDGVSKAEGGNLYLYTTSTTVNGATVSRHSALTITGGTIQNGSATRGGGIFANTGGNLSSGNWTIEISGGTVSGKATDKAVVVLRNNTHATISGGRISGGVTAIQLERSGTSGAISKLTLTGDASVAGTNTEIFVDKSKSFGQLHITDLKAKTPLRIDATDVGEIATTSSDCSLAFISVREGYAVGYTGGKLTLVPAVAQVGDRSFASVNQAIAGADGSHVKLLNNASENVTVDGQVYLDLNGFELTGDIDGEGTLYGMDSATDSYTTDTMGRITGTVSCAVAGNFKTGITGAVRRYMAISDDNGYTFHRFYMGITHMNLKPGVGGVGYKAVFYGDDLVRQQVAGYGYMLWLGENGKKLTAGKEGSFVSGQTVTASLRNFDVENYGEVPVYGQVYLTLADGTTIKSSECSYTFRSLVELVAANAGSYSETQLSALRNMLSRFEAVVSNWNIDGIM